MPAMALFSVNSASKLCCQQVNVVIRISPHSDFSSKCIHFWIKKKSVKKKINWNNRQVFIRVVYITFLFLLMGIGNDLVVKTSPIILMAHFPHVCAAGFLCVLCAKREIKFEESFSSITNNFLPLIQRLLTQNKWSCCKRGF